LVRALYRDFVPRTVSSVKSWTVSTLVLAASCSSSSSLKASGWTVLRRKRRVRRE
jgi:hypothetical protein